MKEANIKIFFIRLHLQV